jgi:hypothetical protein
MADSGLVHTFAPTWELAKSTVILPKSKPSPGHAPMNYLALPALGRLEGLYLCQQAGSLVSTPQLSLQLAPEGPLGDKHAGFWAKSDGRQLAFYPRGTGIRNNRQWSAVSVEELATIQAQMGLPLVRPEWLGANLLVSGIPHFSQLPPMTLLVVRPDRPDKVVLVVHDENQPCVGPHKVIQAQYAEPPAQSFAKAALGRRGLVGWVEKAGPVAVGEPVQVLVPDLVAPARLARWGLAG